MIFLIWWPPKCGKTTLAKELSKKTWFSYISADTLHCIARAYVDKSKVKDLFPVSSMQCSSNNEKYDKYSDKEILEAYVKQWQTTYNAIEMVTICELTEKNDFIIEGYHITPELVHRLIKKYWEEEIRYIFLVKIDKEEFIKNIKKSATSNDWIIEKTKNEETYGRIAKMICRYSKYFKHQARSYWCVIHYMDEDFENKIDSLVDFITK